jgi:acylphosphatase
MQRGIHVYYSGRVQGVGFRFTVEDIARDCAVNGWVKNLRDGRVELVVEAEEAALQGFLSRIKQYFRSYIQNVDIQWQEPTGEFRDFRIRF